MMPAAGASHSVARRPRQGVSAAVRLGAKHSRRHVGKDVGAKRRKRVRERKDVPSPVIITEYVEIANAFFNEEEPKLVNAVLDSVARKIRGTSR